MLNSIQHDKCHTGAPRNNLERRVTDATWIMRNILYISMYIHALPTSTTRSLLNYYYDQKLTKCMNMTSQIRGKSLRNWQAYDLFSANATSTHLINRTIKLLLICISNTIKMRADSFLSEGQMEIDSFLSEGQMEIVIVIVLVCNPTWNDLYKHTVYITIL